MIKNDDDKESYNNDDDNLDHQEGVLQSLEDNSNRYSTNIGEIPRLV